MRIIAHALGDYKTFNYTTVDQSYQNFINLFEWNPLKNLVDALSFTGAVIFTLASAKPMKTLQALLLSSFFISISLFKWGNFDEK